jgi:hypothetical protein
LVPWARPCASAWRLAGYYVQCKTHHGGRGNAMKRSCSDGWVTPSRTVGWACACAGLFRDRPRTTYLGPNWPILPRCNHPCLCKCLYCYSNQTDRGLDISTVLTVLKGCRASESYHSYTMCSSFETELLPPVEEGRVSWTGPTNKCEPKIGRA